MWLEKLIVAFYCENKENKFMLFFIEIKSTKHYIVSRFLLVHTVGCLHYYFSLFY